MKYPLHSLSQCKSIASLKNKAYFKKIGATMKKILAIILLIILLTGCVAAKIDSAIKKHENVVEQINLGDSKDKVLAILIPTQAGLSSRLKKPPEKYFKNDVVVEIYFMRSGRQPDGLTTDDEFTPYLFNDGKLVGIGWQVLGGATTQGQTSPVTNVQQNVIVY